MRSILVLGAGRSAGFFIDYIVKLSKERNWKLTIADLSVNHLESLKAINSSVDLQQVELSNAEARRKLIKEYDWVVSLLPAFMHVEIAKDCLRELSNFATASYVSDEMRLLGKVAEEKGLIFLNECGLDPGIDHMSAMKIIHELQENGSEVIGYQSYCGGLVAPEYANNPWKYKFSWNPRNVVLAGNGTSTSLVDGYLKVTPYHLNFQRPIPIKMPGNEAYEGYINRDSLSYQSVYGLKNVKTMVRGTLRYPGYCRAWNLFIHLGLTDHTYKHPIKKGMTYREFFHSYLLGNDHTDIAASIRNTLGMEDYEDDAINKVLWTGINEDEVIPENHDGSPSSILQGLLERKWKLEKDDKDLIVMQHQFEYLKNGKQHKIISSLQLEGEGNKGTAMAKTVGLPLAIAVKTLIDKPIKKKGIVIPIYKEIYKPVLEELEGYGIKFTEEVLLESVTESKPE